MIRLRTEKSAPVGNTSTRKKMIVMTNARLAVKTLVASQDVLVLVKKNLKETPITANGTMITATRSGNCVRARHLSTQ
jgi:hypothetical protein